MNDSEISRRCIIKTGRFWHVARARAGAVNNWLYHWLALIKIHG